MNSFVRYTSYVLILTILSTCKKYDEGGIVKLSRKHLFGHRKDNATKTWKLKLYEVNGIDSTFLIPGANQIPDFYNKFITFKLDNDEGFTFSATSFMATYGGTIDYVYKDMTIATHDTSQCKSYNNTSICSRILLQPEGVFKGRLWKIRKLTKKEFVLTNEENLTNRYRLEFEAE